ncbi:MAG: trypsin-like peptidase domain-containing protein [Elusimicrobia bacterium]|nr:trypsin-like peptidase domain-containing protein [Elusimicrobiota bacterium]
MIPVQALALLLCGLASGGTLKPARFYLPDNVPRRPAAFEAALAATVGIERVNEGRFCSGVVISPAGYVLTNLHCVLYCLEDAGWAERGLIAEESGDGYKIARIAEGARAAGQACPDYAIARDSGEYLIGPRIVLLGRAKSNFSEEQVSRFPPAAVESLREGMDDYAILKFEPAAPLPCARPAPAPRPGEPIWGVGYPAWTSRHDGFDSSGYKKHVSFGEVRDGIRSDPYMRDRIHDEESWRRLERIYSAPELILSSLDIMPGNSGGPLYDSSGLLVGISWGTVAYDKDRETRASALGLRLDAVMREAAAALGADRAAEIFACAAAAVSSKAAMLDLRGPLEFLRIDFDGTGAHLLKRL